ncbi:MAG: immunoglobulin domain-containing protein, partial [Lutibacter sp.]
MKKITLINLATFLVLLFSTTVGYSQLAPITVPTGGFRIDGDLQSNTPTTGEGDWIQGPSGSGGYVFDNAGNPINISRTLRVIDRYDSTLDNIFTGGGKFNQNPSTAWSWTTNKAGGKGDINNVFLHLGEATNNDQWLIIASDRLVTTGASYIDFEFLQNSLTANVGGTFTAGGPNNGRTNGDLLIAVEYSNGGSNAIVKFYKWVNTDYVLQTPPATAFGQTNLNAAATFTGGAFGNNTYSSYQFVEAAINISAFFTLNDPCGGAAFGNILVKTKSSNAPTAALDDFVNPIPVQLNLGTASISYNTSDFCGATASVTINGVQGGTFSSSSSNLSINTSTGEINVAASTPGTYTVTYSFTTAGCPKTATVQVIIPETSTPPTTSPVAYCAGDIASALTATGTNLLWYTASTGGTGGSTAPTPSTVSAGTTTYYVSQTITNSCESSRASLVVTINALPVVDAGSYGPVCIDATDITLVGSPVGGVWSGTGVTGNLFDP